MSDKPVQVNGFPDKEGQWLMECNECGPLTTVEGREEGLRFASDHVIRVHNQPAYVTGGDQ